MSVARVSPSLRERAGAAATRSRDVRRAREDANGPEVSPGAVLRSAMGGGDQPGSNGSHMFSDARPQNSPGSHVPQLLLSPQPSSMMPHSYDPQSTGTHDS